MKETVFFKALRGLPGFPVPMAKALTSSTGQGKMDIETFSVTRRFSLIK
jgi:hypothetical protein